jgi:hypothetical protein
MSETLVTLSRLSLAIQDLKVNPFLVAVTLALLAAWLEQRFARRSTPRFTTDHQGEARHVRRRAPR